MIYTNYPEGYQFPTRLKGRSVGHNTSPNTIAAQRTMPMSEDAKRWNDAVEAKRRDKALTKALRQHLATRVS